MSTIPRYILLSLALTCLLTHTVNAKTVFRRTDKISDHFKQLDLPPEEIDPNVAPLDPLKIDTINPGDATSSPVEDVLEEANENAAGNDLVDEAINEVDTGLGAAVTAAAPVATPAPASTTAASTLVTNTDDLNELSKHCKCTESSCNCCREFGLPLIPVRGPGCAKITYLGDQKMSVSIKYGDITLATRTISGKKARPICVGLPGGYSQFCGRIYGLSKAKENFKACLGFELRADDDVEASLRVSCFKFGPEGLRVAEAEPLPSEVVKDEDDDDDDIFGFGAGGDDGDDEDDDYDDDDDDAEEPEEADADDADDDADDDDDDLTDDIEAPADADYGGFSLGGLIDELTDDDEDETKPIKPAISTAVAAVETPASVGATRAVQNKEDNGNGGGAAAAALSETAVSGPTTAATTTVAEVSTKKSRSTNPKNSSKKKKKKAAATDDAETDFAYEFLNGILDFFN